MKATRCRRKISKAELLELLRDPALSLAAIAERAGVTPRSMNVAVSRLRREGEAIPYRYGQGGPRRKPSGDQERFLAILDRPESVGRRIVDLAAEADVNLGSAQVWARRHRPDRARAKRPRAARRRRPVDPELVAAARRAREAARAEARAKVRAEEARRREAERQRRLNHLAEMQERREAEQELIDQAVHSRRVSTWYRWQARRRRQAVRSRAGGDPPPLRVGQRRKPDAGTGRPGDGLHQGAGPADREEGDAAPAALHGALA